MRSDAAPAMIAGLARIREEVGLPSEFPADVLAAAARATARRPSAHADLTGRRFVTLDPATSTDLDQAFAIERAGDDLILHYAIADVGWFVHPGDALDLEAFRRGVTVYLPDGRVPLYPTILSEGAASLLPGVDRPSVVFTVRVGSDGSAVLDGASRAVVRSAAKLAYDRVTASDLPDGFEEISRRISAAEAERGASRVEFPEQEVVRTDGGSYGLRFRPRLASEEANAALSLATNLAVAEAMHAAGAGLFRVMPEPSARSDGRLRNSARAFGLDWPAAMPLADFQRSLPRDDPRSSAFLLAVRRAAGGAGYVTLDGARDRGAPWHAAIAARYAQATAPLRRLQDRYVIATVLALVAGADASEAVAALDRLPAAMARGEQRANRAERAALELAEAVALDGRQGEIFDAVVVDEADGRVDVQIADPAVLVRIDAHHVDPGDRVRVRLVAADPERRVVTFARVS